MFSGNWYMRHRAALVLENLPYVDQWRRTAQLTRQRAGDALALQGFTDLVHESANSVKNFTKVTKTQTPLVGPTTSGPKE